MAQGITDGMSLREQILQAFQMEEKDLRTYSPLNLAFLGDAVYAVVIRTIALTKGNRQIEKLHREASALCSAVTQAAIGEAIYEDLTEEEKQVFRRGHNSHPSHHAKHATMEEYLEATALETLLGYLFLKDETERIVSLLQKGLQTQEEGDRLGESEPH
ncbi:MAG: ribonuclease III [Lachnospiraceae bacterium]|nr:ribonuclease III [Lachnospiraceae bacterium]